jgi:hypothetical protein
MMGRRLGASIGAVESWHCYSLPVCFLLCVKWAFDLYPADLPIAAHRRPPSGFPEAGWSRNGEIANLPDVKPWILSNASYPGLIRDPEHAPLRRGYYAAVSLMDAQLGKVGWGAQLC